MRDKFDEFKLQTIWTKTTNWTSWASIGPILVKEKERLLLELVNEVSEKENLGNWELHTEEKKALAIIEGSLTTSLLSLMLMSGKTLGWFILLFLFLNCLRVIKMIN